MGTEKRTVFGAFSVSKGLGLIYKTPPDLLALRQAVPEFIEGQGPVKS